MSSHVPTDLHKESYIQAQADIRTKIKRNDGIDLFKALTSPTALTVLLQHILHKDFEVRVSLSLSLSEHGPAVESGF